MGKTVIKVEGLSKRYHLGLLHRQTNSFRDRVTSLVKRTSDSSPDDIIWALKDVSFQVREGEILGIIGHNGAGKSTLLKILSRITKPTDGYARINGRMGSLLEVGTGFHPELTGRENVFLNGAILGMRKAEIKKKFDEIVAFAEVEKFIGTPVKRYSSGMYVRLAFAVAAYLEPEILLMDEVLAVGDARFQKKCLGKMEDVATKGRTILFVSHNMTAISTLCSSVLYLQEGKGVFLGGVKEGIDKYYSEMSDDILSQGNIEDTDRRYGPAAFSKLISIQTLDGRDNVTTRFEMGSTMKVKIGFRLTEDVHNLEIGWSIFSTIGAKLHTFVGNWEGMTPEFTHGTYSVVCEVPTVNLFPGIFRITPWIKREGENVDDQVPMATEFEVAGANVTGHYQYFDRYPHSGVFQRSIWAVEKCNTD